MIAVVKIRHFVARLYNGGAGLHTGSSGIFSRQPAGMLKFVIAASRRLPVLGLGSVTRTWGSTVKVTVGIVARAWQRASGHRDMVIQARAPDA